MAHEIRITLDVGTQSETSVAVPLGGTRAQVGASLTRYMLSFGQIPTGTVAQKLEQFLLFLKTQIKNRNRGELQKELEAANATTIQTQLETENTL